MTWVTKTTIPEQVNTFIFGKPLMSAWAKGRARVVFSGDLPGRGFLQLAPKQGYREFPKEPSVLKILRRPNPSCFATAVVFHVVY